MKHLFVLLLFTLLCVALTTHATISHKHSPPNEVMGHSVSSEVFILYFDEDKKDKPLQAISHQDEMIHSPQNFNAVAVSMTTHDLPKRVQFYQNIEGGGQVIKSENPPLHR